MRIRYKPDIFIFVHIHIADICSTILIIYIVCTAFTASPFFSFHLNLTSFLHFLHIFYFLLAFSNSIYYTNACRKDAFYNPLLIIYTPLKRPMAPPSVFYFLSSTDSYPIFPPFIPLAFLFILSPFSFQYPYHKNHKQYRKYKWCKNTDHSADDRKNKQHDHDNKQDQQQFLPPFSALLFFSAV